MTDAEFRGFFNRVESYFALKRGQAAMLSPEEFELVEDLYQRKIQLELVLRGIDRFFEKKKKARRKSTRRTVFLTHVMEDIEEVVTDAARKGVGSHIASGPTETEFMEERLDDLLSSLKDTAPDIRAIADEAAGKLRALKERADELTMDDMESELETVYQFSRNQISDKLNPETMEAVEAEVEELAARAGRDITPDILERFKEERLLAALHFPVITLFG